MKPIIYGWALAREEVDVRSILELSVSCLTGHLGQHSIF
jgi:hypothetical protein